MVVLSYLVEAIAQTLDLILALYMWIVIAAALVSWVSPDPYNPIVRFLYSATEPVLMRVRRYVPSLVSGIDFSPLILIFAIIFVRSFAVRSLLHVAYLLRRGSPAADLLQ